MFHGPDFTWKTPEILKYQIPMHSDDFMLPSPRMPLMYPSPSPW